VGVGCWVGAAVQVVVLEVQRKAHTPVYRWDGVECRQHASHNNSSKPCRVPALSHQ
jgi:hypothetical protein